jgi:hypothetical protein
MEPLTPSTKRQILDNNPQASTRDLQEYERLLAQRFTVDPDLETEPSLDARSREERLEQLYHKLFEYGEAKTEARV